MKQENNDLIVIGGGSAGFAAAIRGCELGAKVTMVNAGKIGGTCVNNGCIPSKTLIRAAEAHYRAGHHGFAGMEGFSKIHDFSAIIRQKDELVTSLRQEKYSNILTAYQDLHLIEGEARFFSLKTIRIDDLELHGRRIVITTGSIPRVPSVPGLLEVDPLTSTTVFALERLPASVIVLGGRFVALECAQMLARLGAEVTLLQRSDQLLPEEDSDVAEMLAGYLRDESIAIETSVRVKYVTRRKGHVEVHALVGGEERFFVAEHILCATGRRPMTDGLGMEEVGVRLDNSGRIVVDDYLQTSVAGIFAAGDVVGAPAFVYTAAYEGRLAVDNALGGPARKRDYQALPWVIFTDPQVAGVGLNEKQASRAGIEVDTATLGLDSVPRALAARNSRGFIKLIKERHGDRLLGTRILAPEGGEQIMEAAMAISHGIGVSEIAALFHPYLTQAEGIKLCAQAFFKDVKKLSCCAA
jgi:mercuric reductase